MGPETDNSHLLVFADDWDRHPSSCQHLVRQLLDRHQTLWINTTGTRTPRLSLSDLARAAGRLRRRFSHREPLPEHLHTLSPHMYPGFRSPWQRRFNRNLLTGQINTALSHHFGHSDEKRIAVTTVPIAADLMGRLDVDRWVYYCVDDFSVWPGLDADVLRDMEQQLVAYADAVITVSPTLQQRLADMGRPDAPLLTHGIDLDHWYGPQAEAAQTQSLPKWWRSLLHTSGGGPICLFWGLIDQRLDTEWCRGLAEALIPQRGSLVLVGPQQNPDRALSQLPGVLLPGEVRYERLPRLAAAANALVMPYADLDVTRAMQPLKFKEYLATGKPVLARDLPSIRDWADATDLLTDAAGFVRRALQRLTTGTPPEQLAARRRLIHESWSEKARLFESLLQG